VATSFELMRDAASHAKYPFTRCPAYVVHGEQDQMLPLENSLAWVRGASVGMRGGRVGTSDELVGERRLLEIGAGHGHTGVLRDVQLRLLSYWDLLGDDVVDPESINAPDFESSSYASETKGKAAGHEKNWEVYDEYVKKNFPDRDDDEDKAK